MKKQKARLVIFYNEEREDKTIIIQFYSEVEKTYLTEVTYYVEEKKVLSDIFLYIKKYQDYGYDIHIEYAPLKHLEKFENGEI